MHVRYGRCGKRRPHFRRVSHTSHSNRRRCCFNQKDPQIPRGRPFLVLCGVVMWLFVSGDTASPNAKEWTKEDLQKAAQSP